MCQALFKRVLLAEQEYVLKFIKLVGSQNRKQKTFPAAASFSSESLTFALLIREHPLVLAGTANIAKSLRNRFAGSFDAFHPHLRADGQIFFGAGLGLALFPGTGGFCSFDHFNKSLAICPTLARIAFHHRIAGGNAFFKTVDCLSGSVGKGGEPGATPIDLGGFRRFVDHASGVTTGLCHI